MTLLRAILAVTLIRIALGFVVMSLVVELISGVWLIVNLIKGETLRQPLFAVALFLGLTIISLIFKGLANYVKPKEWKS